MIRSILSWSTALLVLCSGLLASCDDKDEGGGNPPAPAVTLAVGDAASNTLKFTLTLSDADKCTYVCTKSSEAVPSAEKILADGKSVTASDTCSVQQTIVMPQQSSNATAQTVCYGKLHSSATQTQKMQAWPSQSCKYIEEQ